MSSNRFFLSIPVLFLAACGGTTPVETKKEAAAPVAAVPSEDAASISGKVMFSGAKPVPKSVSMDATPACAKMHTTPPVSEEVVVNADGSLKNVFVYVKAGLPSGQSYAVPKESVKVDQNGCIYKPHVVGILAGQDLEFLNSDDTNHNIHPLPRANREWNESQPPKGEHKIKTFAKEELMMPVKCNVHPWMRLYINVVSHPFHAVTGDDGTFTLKGLPPGEYTIEALHEKFEALEIKVKVGPKEAGKAEFTFKG